MTGVTPEMECCELETFGPLVPIIKYDLYSSRQFSVTMSRRVEACSSNVQQNFPGSSGHKVL